jgi:hypothetical protein
MAEVRIATFNIENFDETAPDEWPSLAERIELMQPHIVRLRAANGSVSATVCPSTSVGQWSVSVLWTCSRT